MKTYIVSIEFWGNIEAQDPEEAFNKVVENLNCEGLIASMVEAGITDVNHVHNDPELLDD